MCNDPLPHIGLVTESDLRREHIDDSIWDQIENCISTCRHYGKTDIAAKLRRIQDELEGETAAAMVCPVCQSKIECAICGSNP